DDAVDSLRQLARVEAGQGDQTLARRLRIRALNSVRESRQPAVAVAEIQAEMGDLASAIRTVAMISTEDKKQYALYRVTLALAAMGNVREAIAVIERMTSTAVKNQAWIAIACWSPAP